MKINKKKAFTLTELLVVVLVLGILATVAIPKFKRVLETRKVTEAEDMLSAVRTEQESRCAAGKKYLTTPERLPIMAQAKGSANYDYKLLRSGMSATSKLADYSIKMPSYEEGILCCEGNDCEELNKSYPACTTLSSKPDECASEISCDGDAVESCGCKNMGTRTRSCDTNTGNWKSWGECSIPEACQCSGNDTQRCGCKNQGTQTRTCDTTTGEWSEWGSCSIPEACECSGVSIESCGCNDLGTRSRTCDTTTGEWSEWGSCSISDDCCATITSSNWSSCCSGKSISDSSCYRTCSSEKNTGYKVIKTEIAKSASGAFFETCNEKCVLTSPRTCSSVGEICCDGTYRYSCVMTMEKVNYYCASYTSCSLSCDGYKNAEEENDDKDSGGGTLITPEPGIGRCGTKTCNPPFVLNEMTCACQLTYDGAYDDTTIITEVKPYVP